jgi:hypothetical protein
MLEEQLGQRKRLGMRTLSISLVYFEGRSVWVYLRDYMCIQWLIEINERGWCIRKVPKMSLSVAGVNDVVLQIYLEVEVLRF